MDGTDSKHKTEGEKKLSARRLPLRRMVPNIVTLLAFGIGLTALRFGFEGRFETAMICVVVAIFLDAFDGRLARVLKAETPLGAQLDSLADFVNFGIVPPILVYLWALQETSRLGWAVVLLFAVCCALRLARFNVDLEDADRPAWKMRFFVGVPSPAAGGLVMFPLYLHFAGIYDLRIMPLLLLAYMVIIGLFMVSRFPTYSSKGASPTIRRDMVLPLMLLIGGTMVALLTFTWMTLGLFSLLYVLSMPFSFIAYHRLAS